MKKIVLFLSVLFIMCISNAPAQTLNFSYPTGWSALGPFQGYNFGNVSVGSTSAETYFTVSGSGFAIPGVPLLIQSQNDVKLSLTSGGPYSTEVQIIIDGSGGFPNTNIYVVSQPTATGFRGGTVNFVDPFGGFSQNGPPYPYCTGTTPTAPEIDIQGNSQSIPNGSTTPSAFDHTDFGSIASNVTQTRTFTILNTGNANLTLTDQGGGTYVAISGADAANFTVTTPPAITTIPASSSTTFVITFDPDDVVDYFTATVTVRSNDSDENPYTYAIAGTSTAPAAPEIEVQGNSTTIPDGSTTPTLADHTDFGTISSSATQSRTFTINNLGSANLTLTGGSSSILIGGTNSGNFSVTATPSSPVVPAGSTTFTIQFDPDGTAGYYQATVSIGNNDSDENPYNFSIAGTASASAPTVGSTTDATSITSTQAVSGGNVTSNGGSAITDRGVCYAEYSESTDPTTADFTASAATAGTGSYTVTITGLSCGTHYEYLAYAINASGTAYGPTVKDFWTLSLEPNSQTSSFTSYGYSTTQITIEFDALNSITDANRYLILMQSGSAPDELPVDGNIYTTGDLDNEFLAIITDENATSHTIGGLSSGTDYYFKIFPYNVCTGGSKADVPQTANYRTSPSRVTNSYTAPATATWAGTGTWSTTSNWTPRLPGIDTDVTINSTSSGELTVDQDVTVNDFTISADGRVTVNSGKTLTVTGNFEIQSDAGGTGSFLDQGTTSVSGTTTVKQYLSLGQRYFVSSPVSGGTFDDLQSSPNGSHDFYWYQESENLWRDLNGHASTSPLVVGRGYEVYYGTTFPDPDGLSFNGVYFNDGTLNNSSASPTITYSGPEETMIGWNLVGNHFPCAVSWELSGWTRTNLYGSVYVWNGSQYVSWNGSTGGLVNGIIPSMQAFFVRASSTGAQLTIPRAARVHDAQPHYKNQLANLLVLQTEGNGYEDKTYINFAFDATPGFDNYYDAFKLPGLEAAPQLYSDIGTEALSINVLPNPDGEATTSVQLGFKVGAEGIYEMHASELESFVDASILLIDSKENVTIDLNATPDYSFFAEPGDDIHRFTVLFSGPFGIEDEAPEVDEMKIYSYDRNIFISNDDDLEGEIMIYNIVGQQVSTHGLKGGMNQINVNDRTGYYIVKVVTNSKIFTEKVYIK